MNERAISFGESGALFGILGAPEIPDPQRPAVLIPNTGVTHRVGPGRMHVELARALSAAGLVSLRLDNAGLGDSETVPGRSSETAALDLCAAMDALDARNISSGYVVIGSHNGAHDAHQAARIDPRIIGAVFLDGYVHSTPRAWLNRLLGKVGDRSRSGDPPSDGLYLTPRSGDALHDASDAEIHWFETPTHARMEADLVEFMRRQLALMYVYTGDVERDYHYAAQLIDAFPLLRGYRRLTLRHIPEGDHRYSRRTTREAMIDVLVDWVLSVNGQPKG
ncbi:hypothetical protein [Nevskia sp.]|uniref:hypothetical protein n=1 Tax=Nevskia sp. TaxID=1929292 RepID=UPI0025E6A574|nr:hypothetical protein [Nevskia sp.]